MPMQWIRLMVSKTLFGTTLNELNDREFSIWIKLLLLSGYSPTPGIIQIVPNVGYTNDQLANIIKTSEKILKLALKKLKMVGKISINSNGVITITNWSLYQTEYQRQKPSRKEKAECNPETETDKIETDVETEQNVTPTSGYSNIGLQEANKHDPLGMWFITHYRFCKNGRHPTYPMEMDAAKFDAEYGRDKFHDAMTAVLGGGYGWGTNGSNVEKYLKGEWDKPGWKKEKEEKEKTLPRKELKVRQENLDCPSCDYKTLDRDFKPREEHMCPRCGSQLEIAAEGAELSEEDKETGAEFLKKVRGE